MRKTIILFLLFLSWTAGGFSQQSNIVTTHAGGGPAIMPALSANLFPMGLTVDSAGNVYVMSYINSTIYRIGTDGLLSPFAGTGGLGWWYGGANCEGVPATACGLYYPFEFTFDSAGNMYIADSSNCVIRRVNAQDHKIYRVAGNYWSGYSGDGGPALSASINYPRGVAIDASGNIYIGDYSNHRVRKVDAITKIISTIAGNGTPGFSGDGGPAINASLNCPASLAVDSLGYLYILDTWNYRIRRVDQSGTITTVAGGGSWPGPGDGGPATSAYLYLPTDVALDNAGNIFICEYYRVRRVDIGTGIITTVAGTGKPGFSGDGGPATSAQIYNGMGVAVDSLGNLYISDTSNCRVRRVDAQTQIINTFAGNGTQYYSGDGGPATTASLGEPAATAADPAGNLFIADEDNHRVRRVDAVTQIITTVAGNGSNTYSGDGGPATEAGVPSPWCLALNSAGDLYIGSYNRVRKANAATGLITTVAGTGEGGYSGDDGPATSAKISGPTSLAVDDSGNLILAEAGNHRIRRVDAVTGIISTVAGNGISGFSGDGGQATWASLNSPRSIVIDPEGNLYLLDTGNWRIRRVDAGVDGILSGGGDEVITTVAGGGTLRADGVPATSFQPWAPMGIAMDPAGNLYLAECWRAYVWKVEAGADGTVTGAADEVVRMTVWSSTWYGFCGDGGPAAGACYTQFWHISADSHFNLYLSDKMNFRVRRVCMNQPPVAEAGGPYTGTEGTPVLISGEGSSDPEDNIVSYEWDLDGDGLYDDAFGSTPLVSWPDNITLTVGLKVTDDSGQTDTDTAEVTVGNLAPVIASITTPIDPVPVNTVINVSGSFTDPGVLDTHTAEWNWADGTTSPGVVTETNGSGSVTGSRSYTIPGIYILTLTVTDKDGGTAQATSTLLVVYDPTGAFVTGAGSFESPPGAYSPDPSLTGKAHFGFVSKYQKGAIVPTGQTKFHFQVAGLTFHSENYEWMVIAGARAQYKGTGTINNQGAYGFMIVAIDGQVSGGGGVDKFRIKIWDKATEAVIYDNEMGTSETGDPSTAIDSGSIVIHKL